MITVTKNVLKFSELVTYSDSIRSCSIKHWRTFDVAASFCSFRNVVTLVEFSSSSDIDSSYSHETNSDQYKFSMIFSFANETYCFPQKTNYCLIIFFQIIDLVVKYQLNTSKLFHRMRYFSTSHQNLLLSCFASALILLCISDNIIKDEKREQTIRYFMPFQQRHSHSSKKPKMNGRHSNGACNFMFNNTFWKMIVFFWLVYFYCKQNDWLMKLCIKFFCVFHIGQKESPISCACLMEILAQ